MSNESSFDAPDETALWQQTVEALRVRGATLAEAIDGANIVLQAYRRERDELFVRRTNRGSGQQRVIDPYEELRTG